jgi:competence protein ComEC
MRNNHRLLIAIAALLAPTIAFAQHTNDLNVYFIDVEGGQSTLFVSPSGQSMLIDTGFPGERDATRIAAAAKEAGVSKIDFLLVTHYHGDHVGGVPEVAKRVPIVTFIDHGPSAEQTLNVPQSYATYLSVRDTGQHQHIVAKPGVKLPIKGIDVQVVSAATDLVSKPLPGGGAANPLCSEFQPKDETKDPLLAGENAQSVGTVISLGKFRMVDFGDLTWNHEHGLACPRNVIGSVDLYLTTHHGQNISGLPMLVYALHPRAAVMNNGAKKGGASDTFQILHKSPGLEDLWQLHYAVDAKDLNSPDQLIANPDETTAYYIKVTARPDGSFTITNSRNGYHKDYGPHS